MKPNHVSVCTTTNCIISLSGCMRITFDIDANDLKKIQRITGQKKKSPAISRALADFLRSGKDRPSSKRRLPGKQTMP